MKSQSLIWLLASSLVASVTAATVPGAPTNVTAVSWPYTALISFAPPPDNGGAPITSYTVTAVGAAWIFGSGPTSPIMVQGGPKQWSGATYQFTVTATNSAGTGPASAPSTAVGCTGGTSALVYSNGVFYWEGDFTSGGAVSFADTTGHPAQGPFDEMFTSQGTGNGGWSQWAPGGLFDLTGYGYLEMDLKPTIANKKWTVVFELTGDVLAGPHVTLPSDANGTYGPTPAVGQWASYKIPLALMNVGPGTPHVQIYKFIVTDATTAANVTYADNIKFTASTSVTNNRTAAVASANRSMTASVNNRTIGFAVKNTGELTVYDLAGNRLAVLHAESARTDVSWTAPASGAYLVRFEGAGTAGMVETRRIVVK